VQIRHTRLSKRADDSAGSDRFDCFVDDGDLDLLDDFLFEPTAWDLAMAIGLGVEADDDREALDELADAMLMWANGPEVERLTTEALDRLWEDELERLIREGLVRLAADEGWEQGAATALAEFDRSPRDADVSREVVRHLAMQLGSNDHPVFFCLLCIDETLPRVEPGGRRELACRVAIVARRNAAVSEAEAREALAGFGSRAPATRLGTLERRQAVRARLGRLGALGEESMPGLAAELRAIAAEPLPKRVEDDDVWAVACTALLADVARPERN
jgi:hypothetical protein